MFTPESLARTTTALAGKIEEGRRNALLFSLGVAMLTPCAVFLAIAVAIGGVLLILGNIRHTALLISQEGTLIGFNISIIFIWLIFMYNQYRAYQYSRPHWRSVVRAAIGLGLILFLSHTTSLPQAHPVFFWCAYLFLILYLFAIMGRAYDASVEDESDADSPETFFSIVSFIPMMLLEAYATVCSDSWVWRGLDKDEIITAAGLLYAVADRDTQHEQLLLETAGKDRAWRILSVLRKLELVRASRNGLRLTTEAEALIQNSPSAGAACARPDRP